VLITWHVFAASDSLHTVAINALMFWGPSVLLGPIVGWLVDRYTRKGVLIVTNVCRIATFIGVGWALQSHHSVYWSYLITGVNGATFAFALPAFGAFTRELVADKDLLLANTTIDAVFELANVLGMGLTAVLVLTLNFATGMIIVGLFIALGVAMLLFIRNSDLLPYEKEPCNHFIDDWRFAFHTLKNNRLMLWLSVLSVILFVQFMVAPNLVTPFIKHQLHGGAKLFSLVETACCIGMITSSMMLPALAKRIGWSTCLFAAISGITLCLLFFSFNHSQTIAVAIYLILGFCYTSWALVISRCQELMPKAQQGRIQATLNTASSLLILLIYLALQAIPAGNSIVHIYWYFAGFGVAGLLVLIIISKTERLGRTTVVTKDDGC
jgi:MFS family permease